MLIVLNTIESSLVNRWTKSWECIRCPSYNCNKIISLCHANKTGG